MPPRPARRRPRPAPWRPHPVPDYSPEARPGQRVCARELARSDDAPARELQLDQPNPALAALHLQLVVLHREDIAGLRKILMPAGTAGLADRARLPDAQ